MDLPKRKELRLEYDYASYGDYFITICTIGRENILGYQSLIKDDLQTDADGDYIAPKIYLREYGEIVEKYIKGIVGIDKYVVMPNHIHMIIAIDDESEKSNGKINSIPQIIKSFKTLITKEIGHSILQRNYYEHIIRDEKDYARIWKYIDENPLKWADDEYFE